MTTQAPIDPKQAQAQQKNPRVQVYWRAVTYKTVLGYGFLLVAIISGGIYLAKPDLYATVIKKLNEKVSPDVELQTDDQKRAKFAKASNEGLLCPRSGITTADGGR